MERFVSQKESVKRTRGADAGWPWYYVQGTCARSTKKMALTVSVKAIFLQHISEIWHV